MHEMEGNISEDLLLTLSIYLPPQAREILSQTNKSYSEVLTKARDNQFYWLRKLEVLLDITIPESMYDAPHNWKLAHVQARKNPLLLFTNSDEAFYKVGLLARLDPSSNNNFALLTACVRGNATAVARLLQDPKVNPAAMRSNSIKLAAERGHLDVLDVLLLDGRADPTDPGDDGAIMLAIKNKQGNAAIRLLQDPRVSSNAAVITLALNYAIGKGLVNVTNYILSNNIPHILNMDRLFGLVAAKGDDNAVHTLLSLPGTNPTYRNNSAIRDAYKYKHLKVVAELLNVREVRNTLSKDELRMYVDYVRRN